MSDATVVGLRAAGSAVGALLWCERRLATALATAAISATDPAVKIECATLARHADWRARQWFDVLPSQPGLDFAALVVEPADAPSVLRMGDAEAVASARGELVKWLADRTADLAARADAVGEGPTARAALRVHADLIADRALVARAGRG